MAKRNKNFTATEEKNNGNQAEGARAVQSRPAVRVLFPGEGEVVARPSYTFQIAVAPGADSVEVSVDQGPWMACREALGLWWFDWSDFSEGTHELAARTRMGDGISNNSASRRFSVG